MDYYRRYVADYLSKTVSLSMAEDGAYGRMLDWYYANEKPLPKDIERVFAITRARTPAEKKAVVAVLAEHFSLQADGYHNRRADSELGVAVPKIEKMREVARENGKKGGRKPGTKIGTEIGSPEEPKLEPILVPKKNPDGSIRAGLKQPPTLTQDQNLSDASHRADKPPSEPIDVIFQIGTPMLTEAGVKDASARSLLGKLRKMHGDKAVAEAVIRMAAERPSEPAAWIVAALVKPAERGQSTAKSAAEWVNQLLPRKPDERTFEHDGAPDRLD